MVFMSDWVGLLLFRVFVMRLFSRRRILEGGPSRQRLWVSMVLW